MATAYDFTTGGELPRLVGVQTLTSKIIDLKGCDTGDTWDLWDLPAGSTVLAASAVVLEKAGETATFHVGHAGDADGYIVGFNCNQDAGSYARGQGALLVGSQENARTVQVTIASGSTFAAGKFQVTLVVACA